MVCLLDSGSQSTEKADRANLPSLHAACVLKLCLLFLCFLRLGE